MSAESDEQSEKHQHNNSPSLLLLPRLWTWLFVKYHRQFRNDFICPNNIYSIIGLGLTRLSPALTTTCWYEKRANVWTSEYMRLNQSTAHQTSHIRVIRIQKLECWEQSLASKWNQINEITSEWLGISANANLFSYVNFWG